MTCVQACYSSNIMELPSLGNASESPRTLKLLFARTFILSQSLKTFSVLYSLLIGSMTFVGLVYCCSYSRAESKGQYSSLNNQGISCASQ